MKQKDGKSKQSKKQTTTPATKWRRILVLVVGVILLVVAFVMVWRTSNNSENAVSTTSPASSVQVRAVQDGLVGRWVRTDSNGGYTLEIRGASDNGKLDASYFNPNPINVGSAAWHNKEGSLSVVVELRDVNYPGSTYTLSFSKTNDLLVGTYYQAVESVNYDVTFARRP
jgi:hypothetical protein